MFQLVGLDVGFVQFHTEQADYQPFGQAVAPGDVFAFFLAPSGQPDALVGADVHQALFLHPAQHSGYGRDGGAQAFGGGELAQGFGQLRQRGDFGVLPHFVEGQQVVFGDGRQALAGFGGRGGPGGFGGGFAWAWHGVSPEARLEDGRV